MGHIKDRQGFLLPLHKELALGNHQDVGMAALKAWESGVSMYNGDLGFPRGSLPFIFCKMRRGCTHNEGESGISQDAEVLLPEVVVRADSETLRESVVSDNVRVRYCNSCVLDTCLPESKIYFSLYTMTWSVACRNAEIPCRQGV
jgi:hypothetical protein